jgi:putative ABC transport system substrate-binding protein
VSSEQKAVSSKRIGAQRVRTKILVFICLLLTVLLPTVSLQAQQSEKVARIGFLSAGSATSATVAPRVAAFRQGLQELGYVEGKNVILEARYADGRQDRLKALADDLVRSKVDVIVTGGPTATRPAKEASATIPIVMGFDNDPVGAGFVASLSQPGKNVTGLSTLHPEISGKQVEFLKQTVAHLQSIAVVGNWSQPGNAEALKEINAAAELLRVHLQHFEIKAPEDLETVFRNAQKAHADALLVLANPVIIVGQKRFLELAAKNRLPAMYSQPEFVDAGGLMSYTANFNELFHRAAYYVDKILKGAKPADLPVEQPTKFELVINLKTAKQIGLTIPPDVLARADKVIK